MTGRPFARLVCAPTIFTGVNNGMRIAREEIFGSILSLILYRDEEEAITIANDTDYGLQAQVFSSDISRARRVADRIEAGRVILNGAPHEPLAPFGGIQAIRLLTGIRRLRP